ncbi:hypothetical protein BH23GEM6_BH23GEM6_03530 [soil metagenome]
MTAPRHLAKGSTTRTTLAFLESAFGAEVVKLVLSRLSEPIRVQVQQAGSTDEIPFDSLISLWSAADEVLAAREPTWIERSGGFAIESGGVRQYSGILKKSSPLEFLTQRVSLFRLYYQPGNQEVVDHGQGHAVLRLVGFPRVHPLFCRRQAGGLQRALEIAGGTDATVRHVRCTLEGDAFCEWELCWS